MGKAAAPLPPEFGVHPFSTRAALTAGLSRRRLRAKDLEVPFRGVRRAPGAADTLRNRCLALAVRLPRDAFFCGPTAALLYGMPLPLRLENDPVLHVAVPPPRRAPRGKGVRGRTLAVAPTDLRDWLDVTVTSPARTWRDLAPELSLRELVAVGDFALHGHPAPARLTHMESEVLRARGDRGVTLMRRALPLLDGRAESPRESYLRLALIAGGVTGWVPNHRVQLRNPSVRYRIDMAFPEAMLGIEYQGGYHHDEEQWRKDMTRKSRLRAHGWAIEEISKDDLADPRELAHRIQALRAQRGER